MVELVRYLLALLVAEVHVWPLRNAWMSWQAVFAFYALSGYLMTRVLHERYGFTPRGTGAFILNRVLRLWPAYLVIIGLMFAALQFMPLDRFFGTLRIPRDGLEMLVNLTILGQVVFDFPHTATVTKLASTSWSLSIELFCYLLLAVYFGKTPARLAALALIGVVAITISTGYCAINPSPIYGPYCFQNRYGVLQAGFIPFAAGGLAYFYRALLREWILTHWHWMIGIAAIGELLCLLHEFLAVTIGPYIGVAAMAGFLAWASRQRRATGITEFLGRASYHLFIAHMGVAAFLVVGLSWRANSLGLLIGTVGVSFALSAVLVPLEHGVERLRRRVSAGIPGGKKSLQPS
jgi:peptidoglycan/LPS O-acetylase OafA/YrhL